MIRLKGITAGVIAASAVSVVSVGAAQAQTTVSNVTLYGRLTLGFDNYAANGANCPMGTSNCNMKSRNRVFDNGSRIGVRGVEDLGGGLRAIFQIESGASVDNGLNTG